MKLLKLFAVACLGFTLVACNGSTEDEQQQKYEQIMNKPEAQIENGDIDDVLSYYKDLTEKFVEKVKAEDAEGATKVKAKIAEVYTGIVKLKDKFSADQLEKLSNINTEYKEDFQAAISDKADDFKAKMNKEMDDLKNDMENLKNKMSDQFENAKDKVEEMGKDAKEGIEEGAEDLKEKAKDVFKK